MAASEDCVELIDISLQGVIRRINIGREDFWGDTSTAWLVLFHVHWVVFVILFTIVICWCGLFLWEKLQAWRKWCSFLYLLAVYCMLWSLSSVLQYILLVVDIIHPPNQILAVATYSFEMITLATSMNGLLILAVYQYYRLKFHAYQSLKKYVLFTGPSLVITIIIIATISTSIGSLAIVVIVVLILLLNFIGMMGTTSLVAMYTELWFRTKSSKSLRGTVAGRILIRRLLFRLASYVYLMLVPIHLLIPFIKLAANSDCVEEARGNRVIWLIMQTIIKLAELFLVTQYLNVPQKIQKLFRNLCSTRSITKPSPSMDFLPKNITQELETALDDLNVVDPFNSEEMLPTKSGINKAYDLLRPELGSNSAEHESDKLMVALDIHEPVSTETPHRLVECINNVPSSNTVEREILPQASNSINNVVEELKVQPYVNDEMRPPAEKLECEFQGNQLLYSVFDELHSRFNHRLYTPPLPDDFSVEIVSTHKLVDTENLVGDVEEGMFDEKEGVFHSHKHLHGQQPLCIEIVSGHKPVDTENLVGDVEAGMFDERGGVFHSHKHGVTVLLPAGAIPSGILAELKFAATLTAPIKLATNKSPVSAIYWLCMDVDLQKPLEVRLPHFVNIENQTQSRSLQFLKSTHSPVDIIESSMNNIIEGEFPIGESYGSLTVNHFCYYCIVEDKLDRSKIPSNKYVVVAMKQREPRNCLWRVDICLLPQLKTCIEKLKDQYGDDWKYVSVDKFSFPQGCEQISIELKGHPFQGEAMVEILSNDRINQEDIDFQQYYEKDLDQLELLMKEKLYPPRFKAIVQAKNKGFFESSKYLHFQLICGSKIIKGKLLMPGHDTFSESSSDSDCSMNNHGSGTSGYRSDSIEHLSDEDDLNSKKLQLRNLMVQTMGIQSKWFELGIALCIPIKKLEKLYDKYNDSPVKALIRVYRFWLADKNNLKPTWEKLTAALQDIKEYILAIRIKNSTSTTDGQYPTVSHDDFTEPEKGLVMRNVKLELLNLTALIPVLNKHNLLASDDNYILVNHFISPLERANVLLYKILPSKGPGAFKTFITCLQEETEHIGHQELAKIIISSMKTTTKAMETTV